MSGDLRDGKVFPGKAVSRKVSNWSRSLLEFNSKDDVGGRLQGKGKDKLILLIYIPAIYA
jgi:hypothetical protein